MDPAMDPARNKHFWGYRGVPLGRFPAASSWKPQTTHFSDKTRFQTPLPSGTPPVKSFFGISKFVLLAGFDFSWIIKKSYFGQFGSWRYAKQAAMVAEARGVFSNLVLWHNFTYLTRAGSLLRSVGPPGRAESYGVTQITDTSRTFHIERYGF